MNVDEKMVAGRAMQLQMIQIKRIETMAISLLVLGARGVIMALLLSRVMASMVNTLAGTVEREMNWVKEQNKEPKYQTLRKRMYVFSIIKSFL